MCQLASIRQTAEHTGIEVADVGLTTARPPWSTVPMGAMAGRPFEPAKRSAIHGRHLELGGNIMWAGDWRRAYDYGDPEAETMAVHDGAGLIDVSTLGKLLVRGPDAGDFLNRLYPNRFDNLKPGRIRHGVLGDDAGRITDDGTDLSPRRRLLLRHDDLQRRRRSRGVVRLVARRLAARRPPDRPEPGPLGFQPRRAARPREIISSLTALDCSNEGFAYLDGKRAHVAGVPCLMLRIGFVGELGYELHCPGVAGTSTSGTRCSRPARTHGIRPFGLEPQRVLRLQKLHILVGQDTDAESNPLEAAMPWIVKFDKKDKFIGRWALEAVCRARRREEPGRLHGCQRRGADRGRGRGRRRQADRPDHLLALLPEAPSARSAWLGCRRRWPMMAPELTHRR